MRKYFKGVNEKASDGWILGVVTGNSGRDNEDWIIDTNSLQADQVPEHCLDAKDFALLVSGLLNCYYNRIETKGLSEKHLMQLGEVEPDEEIPSPENPKLPF